MSELEKALDAVSPVYGDDPEGATHLNTILDAARRLLNLTSPETIEKATEAIRQTYAELGPSRCTSEILAEAVLRSVEEGTE